MSQSKQAYWLYGKHAVVSALKNPLRKVHQVLATDSTVRELKKDLNGYTPKVVHGSQIDSVLKSVNNVHQGIAAQVEPLKQYSINELLKDLSSKKSVIVALDGITDPQNAGAIIRSCVAFNVDALLVTKHNSFAENGHLARASVGTIENIKIASVPNLSHAFENLKEQGYWIIGLDGDGKEDISKVREYDKIVLVLGAEGAGIRRLTKENSDLLVKIKISENCESLNVSVATAIALFEFNR